MDFESPRPKKKRKRRKNDNPQDVDRKRHHCNRISEEKPPEGKPSKLMILHSKFTETLRIIIIEFIFSKTNK